MNHRFSLLALVALLALTITGTGCKEGSIIDAKISPSDTALGVYSAELGCVTRTYYDDTAVSGLFISGLPVYQGAGHITDPFFGTMTGYTAFQVIPDNPSIAVYNNATIDSAFLVLPYAGYTYGDTSDQSLTQTYQAFFLDEFDAILKGQKLIPHWRLAKGINLRRVFLEPQTFDPVLWVQGSAALPYLEDGPVTSAETWLRMMSMFEGNFFGMAVWFN